MTLLAAQLTQVVPRGSRLRLALSGGVDSVVLLHVLAQAAPDQGWLLECTHVHHGLSPNADQWAQFCVSLAARQGLRCTVDRVDLARYRGKSIVEATKTLVHNLMHKHHIRKPAA